jgi:predicted ABC-type ATPase
LPQSNEAPSFWIFGGPNGSGKSTAYGRSDVEGADVEVLSDSFWIVNPDLLTLRIRDAENLSLAEANLAAVQRLEVWLEATLRVHKSLGVETVLSPPKYRRLVETAKSLGFVIRLFYVILDTPQRNVERVQTRVEKGGHAVPPAKIEERYWRSLEQLPWFFEHADIAKVYDNSGDAPELVVAKTNGRVAVSERLPRNLHVALAAFL